MRGTCAERVLELVDERFGGSAQWLAAHGLDGADLELLRRRLDGAGAGGGAGARSG